MQHLFRTTILLSVLIGCSFVRPLYAGGDNELTQLSVPSSSQNAEAFDAIQHKLDSRLCAALRNNNTAMIETVLKEAHNLATPEKPLFLNISLSIAAHNRKINLIKELLIMGTPAKEQHLLDAQIRYTQHAIKKDHADVVQVFLVDGNVNPKSCIHESNLSLLQYTALHKAINSLEILSSAYSEEEINKAYDLLTLSKEKCAKQLAYFDDDNHDDSDSDDDFSKPLPSQPKEAPKANESLNTYTIWVDGKIIATGSTIPTDQGESHPLPHATWGIGLAKAGAAVATVGAVAIIIARRLLQK